MKKKNIFLSVSSLTILIITAVYFNTYYIPHRKSFNVKARVMCPTMTNAQGKIVRLGSRKDINWRRGCYKHFFQIKSVRKGRDEVCHSGYTNRYGRINVKNVSCPKTNKFRKQKIYFAINASGKNHYTCLRRQGEKGCKKTKYISWTSFVKVRNKTVKTLNLGTLKIGTNRDTDLKKIAAFTSQQISRAFDLSNKYFGLSLGKKRIRIELYGGGIKPDGEKEWCWFMAGTGRIMLCNNPSYYWGANKKNAVIHEVGHILHRYALNTNFYLGTPRYCGGKHYNGLRTDNRKAYKEGFAWAFTALYYHLIEHSTEETLRLSKTEAPVLHDHKAKNCSCDKPRHGFDDEGVVAKLLLQLFFGGNLDDSRKNLRGKKGWKYIGRFATETYGIKRYKLVSAVDYFNALRSNKKSQIVDMHQAYFGTNKSPGILKKMCKPYDFVYELLNKTHTHSICKHPLIARLINHASKQSETNTWGRNCED